VEPSEGLKSRVLAAATGEQAPRPAMLTRLFWSAAAVVLFSIVLGTLLGPDFREHKMNAHPDYASARGHVRWADRTLELHASGLPALPAGKEYELWRIRGGVPKRAGQYVPNAKGLIRGRYTMNDATVEGDLFAVTIEPAGGTDSPTGKMPLTPGK
jgi:anti-sigma-K factor RskA